MYSEKNEIKGGTLKFLSSTIKKEILLNKKKVLYFLDKQLDEFDNNDRNNLQLKTTKKK